MSTEQLSPARFVVKDCFNCIDASTPPAVCKRCHGCIDDDERPNWFPKNGADLEYLSWFPIRAAYRARGDVAKPDGRLHADGYFTWNEGKRPAYVQDRGLPCDFYLAPTAPDASQAEQAAMYRWLRDEWWFTDGDSELFQALNPEELDDAIRTAMTKDAALQSEAARGRG